MRKLTFNKLFLLGKKSRQAREISFDPNVNVIRGDNDTGKSSLLKSLYHAFGATASKKTTHWEETSSTCAVDFSLANRAYRILRHGNLFALFSGRSELIHSFTGISRRGGIAEEFASMFDFGIQLPDKQGKVRSLPPAHYFLPYYIDQDAGWRDLWTSFEGLQQFPSYRTNLIQYHTGIREDVPSVVEKS